jgi:hypothetical protein
LRQEPVTGGKNVLPHVVQAEPTRAGSAPVVNQPSIAGAAWVIGNLRN